ncbi:MAG: hypothetical protein QXL01_01350 [Thermoplasmatales archaeon]
MKSMKKLRALIQQKLFKDGPDIAGRQFIKDKLDSKNAIEEKGKMTEVSRSTYGTDPELIHQVNDRFLKTSDRVKAHTQAPSEWEAKDKLKKQDLPGSFIAISGVSAVTVDPVKAAAISNSFMNASGKQALSNLGSAIGSGLSSIGNTIGNAVGLGKTKDELNKGVMSPGSTKDIFPKSFKALQLDGDLHNTEVMMHHMKLHQDKALKDKNPESVKYHWDQVKQIHNHLNSLKKNVLLGYGPQSMPALPGQLPQALAMSSDKKGEEVNVSGKIKKLKDCLTKTHPPKPPSPPMPKVEKQPDPFKTNSNKQAKVTIGMSKIKGV